MFTFESLVDGYTKGIKSMLDHVQPESVKSSLIGLTDKQAEFTKGVGKQIEHSVEYFTTYAKEAFKISTKTK